jgi:DNA-binding NtrC family response regulator
MKVAPQVKIFIVEDNFVYAFILESMLGEYGNFKIQSFSSGEECLARLDQNPHLIVLDYILNKGIDGIETLKLIKIKKPKIPVIALSSQMNPKITSEFHRLGVFDYIHKRTGEKAMNKLRSTVLKALEV